MFGTILEVWQHLGLRAWTMVSDVEVARGHHAWLIAWQDIKEPSRAKEAARVAWLY